MVNLATLVDNQKRLSAAKQILSKVVPEGDIKPFDLEDVLDKLRYWEVDTKFRVDELRNESPRSIR